MEGTLLVDPKDLRNAAQEFQGKASEIQGITSEMMNLVKGLASFYEGEAAQAYVSKFSGLDEDMKQIQDKIREHVNDLTEMAQGYESAESTAETSHNALQSDYI